MTPGPPGETEMCIRDSHCTGERAMEILKEELGDMAEQIYTGFEIEV